MSSLPPVLSPEFLAEWSSRAAGTRASLTPPDSTTVVVHLHWARDIARVVRRAYNFRAASQEALDLEQVACLAVVELFRRFDPARVPASGNLVLAFRGWAAIEVRNRCRREARRLRNGGTYNTRRETPGQALIVLPLRKSSDFVDPRSVKNREEEADEAGEPKSGSGE